MHKNILHLIDTTGPGGAETVFTQLAAYCHNHGYNTLALIRGPGWAQNELIRLGVKTQIKNCKGSLNFEFLRYLIRIIRTEKIHVIQSHLLGSNVYASLAGLLTGCRVISTFHGFVDISAKERFFWAKFLSIRLGSKRVIAVTHSIGEMLRKTTSIPPKKISVIANGIDTEQFAAKTAYSIAPDRPIKIGCLGNVRTAKNYPLAIKTLAKLIAVNINIQLHIAGDDTNSLAQECKTLAEHLGVKDFIIWHGFIDNAARYLSDLDIFLLCSTSEGHPLALTQAMSVGLPIIVTECGVEQVITAGHSALLASNGDSDSIIKQIGLLISDEKKREELGKNAANEARQKWSISQMIKSYQNLYEF